MIYSVNVAWQPYTLGWMEDHIHPTSSYIRHWTWSVYQAFPHTLVLQVTKAGVWRPGYKATWNAHKILQITRTKNQSKFHLPTSKEFLYLYIFQEKVYRTSANFACNCRNINSVPPQSADQLHRRTQETAVWNFIHIFRLVQMVAFLVCNTFLHNAANELGTSIHGGK